MGMGIEYHKTSKKSILPSNILEKIASEGAGAYTDVDRIYRKEGNRMKIIILRTPALVAPILRKMFGIRKEKRR